MEEVSHLRPREKAKDNKHKFLIFFLEESEDKRVHVEEAEEIDFIKISKHLNLGGSVFISPKRAPKKISKYENTKRQRHGRKLEKSIHHVNT